MLTRMILLAVVAALLSACGGPYLVTGRVVSSPFGAIDFVDADDERLAENGVGSAEVRIFRDPGRPNMEQAGRAITGGDGRFRIPLDAFGAGWMDEVWRITVARTGFEGGEAILRLPPARDDRRLLIMVAPGFRTPDEGEDLWDIYERYK